MRPRWPSGLSRQRWRWSAAARPWVLYAVFAWAGGSRPALVGFSLTIGVLIGAEMPLLMTLIQRIRARTRAARSPTCSLPTTWARWSAVWLSPSSCSPCWGSSTGALLTGTVNALAGGALVLWLFRRDLTRRGRYQLVGVNVLCSRCWPPRPPSPVTSNGPPGGRCTGRTCGSRCGPAYKRSSSPRSPHGALDLFLDGRLRVSSRDERQYHQALVDPAMSGPHRRVLILGGGDGLAAAEVLRHPGVTSVTLVELDARRGTPGPHGPGTLRTERPRVPRSAATGGHRRRLHLAAVAAPAALRRDHFGPAGPRDHARAPSSTRRSSTVWRRGCWRPAGGWPSTRARWPPGSRGLLDGRDDDTDGRSADRPVPGDRQGAGLRRGPGPYDGSSGGAQRLGLCAGLPGAAAAECSRYAVPGPRWRAGRPGCPPSTLLHPRYSD